VIYVRRDPNQIPEKIFRVAERAQIILEGLPPEERPAFIRKKSHIWRAFARYLSKMSYGKCWYSESSDPMSFFDVDHFRPKLEARRSEEVTEEGYQWLSFSWENFRYSAQRSNRISKDEETEVLSGKGNWFPLLDPSPKATWSDRCEATERPVLLDPVVKADVDLVTVEADGRMGPSAFCVGRERVHRVQRSVELYGLNLPQLKAARLRVMREINDLHATLLRTYKAGEHSAELADLLPFEEQLAFIRAKTLPNSPYSKAVRAQLARLGMSDLCAMPEDWPEAA